jgi:hypothetical protein
VAALPAAGRPGETRAIELVGFGVATGSDRLESTTRQVTFPGVPTSGTGFGGLTPRGAAGESSFDYRLETAWGQAPPFALLLSDLPETVLRYEPAPPPPLLVPRSAFSLLRPARLPMPGAVTGVFTRGQNEVRHPFVGKKGDHVSLSVDARRLGSPLDVALAVRAPDGRELARNDDLPGTTDAGVDLVLPMDGTYVAVVSDLGGAGGSRAAVYRLALRPTQDDFVLTMPIARLSVHPGQKTPVPLKLMRKGSFKGPVRIAVAGLPPGITVPGDLVIPAGKADLALSLVAAADAPALAAPVMVTGSADVNGVKLVRTVQPLGSGSLVARPPEEHPASTLLVATTLKPRCKADVVDKDTGRKVPRGSTFAADVVLKRLDGFEGDIVLKMAARQSYQVQGITGRDTVVPPGVTNPTFPCFMPEWLETSRTSRLAIIAEARVPDARGTVRHCVVPVAGMVTMTMEGALLKLSHEGREFSARAGQPLVVRVRIARSARLTEPVRLELLAGEYVGKSIEAAPITLAAGQHETDFVIQTRADPVLAGDRTLTIRATAVRPGDLPVVSETTVPVTFLSAPNHVK